MEIVRKIELEKLKEYQDSNLIKIITGARRVGKSSLLKQYKVSLEQQGKKVIYVDLERYEMNLFYNPEVFYEFIKKNNK